jgi:hypothetical protein
LKVSRFIPLKGKRLALKTILGILITALLLPMISVGTANPNFVSRVHSFPKLTVLSPLENQSYPSDNVWFNFTITKPEDWLSIEYRGQITNVPYKIDDTNHIWGGPNQTRVEIQDPLDSVNPAANFSLSIRIEGLQEGEHTLDALVEGYINQTTVSASDRKVHFTVYVSEAEPTPSLSTMNYMTAILVGSGIIVIGIFFIVIRRLKKYYAKQHRTHTKELINCIL